METEALRVRQSFALTPSSLHRETMARELMPPCSAWTLDHLQLRVRKVLICPPQGPQSCGRHPIGHGVTLQLGDALLPVLAPPRSQVCTGPISLQAALPTDPGLPACLLLG